MATTGKKTTSTRSARSIPVKNVVAVGIKEEAPGPAKKAGVPKTEKPARQETAMAKSAPKGSARKVTVTPEERRHMIAVAAYSRAQQRGFVCSCEKHDWLLAEAEIDAMLNA
jgi:hypothetical protein